MGGRNRQRSRTRARQLTVEAIGTRTLFFGALALIGGGLLVPLAYNAVKDRVLIYQVRHRYQEADCTVMSKELRSESDTRTLTHFRGGHQHRGTKQVVVYIPHVEFSHWVDGHEYRSPTLSPTLHGYEDRAVAQGILARYQIGGRYRCRYDPNRPESAFLERP